MEALSMGDLAKLALATFTGAAIGFERESHGQATGLRTNILVCIGACLMMLLSLPWKLYSIPWASQIP